MAESFNHLFFTKGSKQEKKTSSQSLFQRVNYGLGVKNKTKKNSRGTQGGIVEIALHDSSHFKKSLQVVNLSERHGDQDQSFKEGPQDHPAVRVVID